MGSSTAGKRVGPPVTCGLVFLLLTAWLGACTSPGSEPDARRAADGDEPASRTASEAETGTGTGCDRWNLEGFTRGMAETDALALLKRYDAEIERRDVSPRYDPESPVRERTKVLFRRREEGQQLSAVRGSLVFEDGVLVKAGLGSHDAHELGRLLQRLQTSLGPPTLVREEDADSTSPTTVREWADEACGSALVGSETRNAGRPAMISFELMPFEEWRSWTTAPRPQD